MSKLYWHLDTDYFLHYLYYWNKDIDWKKINFENDRARIANSVIKNLGKNNVRIHLFVLAESVSQLLENGVNIGLMTLCGDLEVVGVKRENMALFARIIREPRTVAQLDPWDLIIVAAALADTDCCGLLTFDRSLARSKTVDDLIEKYAGDRDFIVIDDPRQLE